MASFRELRWYADYMDGSRLVEWEKVQGKWKETSFKAVDPRRVIRFGLEGSGFHVWFLTSDGCLHVNQKPLRLYLKDFEGNLFPVTHRSDIDYRGLIQFKEGNIDLGVSDGKKKRRHMLNPCTAYHMGYGAEGSDSRLGHWKAQLIAKIPVNLAEAPEGTLHFMCEKGFRGRLYIGYGEKEISVATVLRPKSTNRLKLNLH